MRCRYKIGNMRTNGRRAGVHRKKADDMSRDRLGSSMMFENRPSGTTERSSYSAIVSVVGVVDSSKRIVLLVSCTRPLSLFTGLVLVGEMERP